MEGTLLKEMYNKADQEIKQNKRNPIIEFLEMHLLIYKLKKIANNFNYNEFLESNDDICSGELVFKGTRIKPKNIWNYISININIYNGNIDSLIIDVIENYPALDEEKVMVALLYCLKNYGYKTLLK